MTPFRCFVATVRHTIVHAALTCLPRAGGHEAHAFAPGIFIAAYDNNALRERWNCYLT